MASSNNDDDGMVSGINVTPLVDVCLVLMVILMITARAMVDQQSMPLDLPKSASGQEVQLIFSLDLSANGQAAVDKKRLTRDDDVLPLAKEALAKNPDLRAVIRADAAVPHGRVIHALDLMKRAGISKVAFAVTQMEVEGAPSAAPVAPVAPTPAPAATP